MLTRLVWIDLVPRHRWLSSVKWFHRGLVFKAHRFVYHSTLGWGVITKKKKKKVHRAGARPRPLVRERRRPLPDVQGARGITLLFCLKWAVKPSIISFAQISRVPCLASDPAAGAGIMVFWGRYRAKKKKEKLEMAKARTSIQTSLAYLILFRSTVLGLGGPKKVRGGSPRPNMPIASLLQLHQSCGERGTFPRLGGSSRRGEVARDEV